MTDMSRRDSREATVKIIFQNEFIDARLRTDPSDGAQLAVEDMVAMFVSSAEEKELKKIDRAFVAEILGKVLDNIVDIPVSVSIIDAVELAKKFSYPEAPAFINGILGSVSRE